MSFYDRKGWGQKSPKYEGKVKIPNQQVFVNQERAKKGKMGLEVWQGKGTHLVEEWWSSLFLHLVLLLHRDHHLSTINWNNLQMLNQPV